MENKLNNAYNLRVRLYCCFSFHFFFAGKYVRCDSLWFSVITHRGCFNRVREGKKMLAKGRQKKFTNTSSSSSASKKWQKYFPLLAPRRQKIFSGEFFTNQKDEVFRAKSLEGLWFEKLLIWFPGKWIRKWR